MVGGQVAASLWRTKAVVRGGGLRLSTRPSSSLGAFVVIAFVIIVIKALVCDLLLQLLG